MQKIRAPLGRARAFDFQITKAGVAQDLTTLTECRVVVDAPDGTDKYTADCAPKVNDPTSRVVILEAEATETRGYFSGCVHFTEAGGAPDAEPFTLEVFQHA